MSSTAASALDAPDHTSRSAAPDRASRSGPMHRRTMIFVRELVRAFRRDLGHATHREATDWMPRLSQYPY